MRLSKFSKVALVFACVALVLSAVLILVPTFSSEPNLPADAAISAASSFDKLSNGSKFYFTNPSANSSSTVTVSSSQPWGSQSNPFVINSTSQWLLFANKINANDSNFNSNKFFLLANDLDFANNSINPVGSSSSGFFGTLYGNKHTIKRIKFNMASSPLLSGYKAIGLFAFLNNASVYDLIFDASNTFSYTPNSSVSAGMLAAHTKNVTIVNVSYNGNLTVSNSGVTNGSAFIYLGGLIGNAQGYNRLYKVMYQGNLNTIAGADSVTSFSDNHIFIGGLIGSNNGLSELTMDAAYIKFNMSAKHGGVCSGGILGGSGTGAALYKLSNILVNCEGTTSGTMTSPDLYGLTGWMSHGTTIKPTSGSYLKNIYLSSETYLGNFFAVDGGATAWPTAPSGTYKYPTTTQNTVTNPVETKAALGAAAAANATLKQYFNITSSSATATSKLNNAGNINYDLGGVQDCKQS